MFLEFIFIFFEPQIKPLQKYNKNLEHAGAKRENFGSKTCTSAFFLWTF